MAVVQSEAGPDYTIMTRPGSDKVERRLAGQTHQNQVKVDSDYLEPSKAAPEYINETSRRVDPKEATTKPDYYELS